MAWAERLPSGRWRGGYRDTAGRKRYITDGGKGYRLKSDARAAAQAAEVKASREAAAEAGRLLARSTTWGQLWDMLEPRRRTDTANTDTTEYYIVRSYLRPRWGEMPLTRMSHQVIQDWVDDLVAGVAVGWTKTGRPQPGYVRRIFAVLRSSMTFAVKRGLLDANPCADITLPALRRKRKTHITTSEADELADALRGDYADAVAFFLETGLRPSELCGLHAHHIDWDEKGLEVCAVLVNRKYVIREWPKDKDSRPVPLSDKALDILRRRLEGRDLTVGCGLPHTEGEECSSPLVFLTDRGRPMNSQVLGDRMRYAAKHRGAPRRSPYAGRRGFATRAARGGLDAFAIASIMGHSDLQQTQGYVQQDRVRGQLRAALGERDPLSLVDSGDVDGGEVEDRESGAGHG